MDTYGVRTGFVGVAPMPCDAQTVMIMTTGIVVMRNAVIIIVPAKITTLILMIIIAINNSSNTSNSNNHNHHHHHHNHTASPAFLGGPRAKPSFKAPWMASAAHGIFRRPWWMPGLNEVGRKEHTIAYHCILYYT